MLQDIKRNFRPQTVIFDMPPLLQGDEVLATLPKIDAVLLVTAVGVSTLHEIKECNRHLQATEVIRVILNKSHETIKQTLLLNSLRPNHAIGSVQLQILTSRIIESPERHNPRSGAVVRVVVLFGFLLR